jgi:hypothetical protein
MTYHSKTATPSNSLIISFKDCTALQVREIANHMAIHCKNISLLAWGIDHREGSYSEFSVLLKNALLYQGNTASIKEFELLRQTFFPELHPINPCPVKEFTFEFRALNVHGILPPRIYEPDYTIVELQQQLDDYVDREDYEKAAEIRDRIENCKKGKE